MSCPGRCSRHLLYRACLVRTLDLVLGYNDAITRNHWYRDQEPVSQPAPTRSLSDREARAASDGWRQQDTWEELRDP